MIAKLLQPYDLIFDLLLATHAHYDHFDVDAAPMLLDNGITALIAAKDVKAECERLGLKGTAIVFHQVDDAIKALREGKIHAGHVVVIRYLGPKGRFGTEFDPGIVSHFSQSLVRGIDRGIARHGHAHGFGDTAHAVGGRHAAAGTLSGMSAVNHVIEIFTGIFSIHDLADRAGDFGQTDLASVEETVGHAGRNRIAVVISNRKGNRRNGLLYCR